MNEEILQFIAERAEALATQDEALDGKELAKLIHQLAEAGGGPRGEKGEKGDTGLGLDSFVVAGAFRIKLQKMETLLGELEAEAKKEELASGVKKSLKKAGELVHRALLVMDGKKLKKSKGKRSRDDDDEDDDDVMDFPDPDDDGGDGDD